MDCTEDCVEEHLEDGMENSVVNKCGNEWATILEFHQTIGFFLLNLLMY